MSPGRFSKWFKQYAEKLPGTVRNQRSARTQTQLTLEALERREVPASLTTNLSSFSAGATSLVIGGSGFDTTKANDIVFFNDGVTGSVTSATATTLTVNLTGLASVTAGNNLDAGAVIDGISAGAPTGVAAIIPSVTVSATGTLTGVSTLTIMGAGFDTTAANDHVTFDNSVTGTVIAASNTSLTVTLSGLSGLATGASLLHASVTVDGHNSGTAVQVASGPLVAASPAGLLSSATSLTIHGAGFDTTTGNDHVTFDNGVTGTVTSATSTALTVHLTGLSNVAAGTAIHASVTIDSTFGPSGVEVAVVGTWVVGSGTGEISLTTAVADADAGSGGGTIAFDSSQLGTTITPGSRLTLSQNVTIVGLGAPSLAISGGGTAGVFTLATGVTASISNLTIENGSVSLSGGGILDQGTLTLGNDILTGNMAGFGGAIATPYSFPVTSGPLILSNCLLSNNTAAAFGGAVYSSDGPFVGISNSVFLDNRGSQGGGMYLSYGTALTLSNSTVSNNSSTYSGGGIFFKGTLATLTGDTINYNSAALGTQGGGGGGINVTGGVGQLTLSGCTLVGNSALNFAGAINYSGSSSLTITNSTISNNITQTSGGGIYVGSGTISISNSSLTFNSAESTSAGKGAGISQQYAATSAMLTNDLIAGNSAHLGGGIYDTSLLTLANSNLLSNTAATGGGIYGASMLTLSDDTISGNTATGSGGGGGLYSNAGTHNGNYYADLTVVASLVSGNSASNGPGGGIDIRGGTLTLNDSTLASNSGHTDGGGIYEATGSTTGNGSPFAGSITLSNATLAANSAATGGGIYVLAGGTPTSRLTLLNTIVAGDTATTGADIDGTVTLASDSLIGNTSDTIISSSTANQLGVTAGLQALANNGGPTLTMALATGSKAIAHGGAVTILTSALAAGTAGTTTTITVGNGQAISSSTGNYLIMIGSEQLLVTSISGNTLTVIRGYNGTTAGSHSSGSTVYLHLDQRGYSITTSTPDVGAYQSTGTAPATPTITGVSPTSGPVTAGLTSPPVTQVTITGTNLNNTTLVSFGGLPATIVGNSNTVVVVDEPTTTYAGTVQISVTTSGWDTTGTSSSDQFVFAPYVTASSAQIASGSSSATITINGAGFDMNPANDIVTFTTPGATGTALTGTVISAASSNTLIVALTGIFTLPPGTTAIDAVVTTDGASSGTAVEVGTVQKSFAVKSVVAMPDGVVLTFNAPINPTTTVLYSSPGSTTLSVADVTVVGATTGMLRGSLVIDATDRYVATFVQTSGLLAPDTYTVTVTTAVAAVGGAVLAGNYSTHLTVAATTTPVLAVPDFARGPAQSVALNPTSGSATGIPVNISNATDVTKAGFSLTYDPTLLSIAATGALSLSSAATTAGLTTLSYNIASVDAHHSVLTVSLSGASGLTATTAATLVTIMASVPDTAPYLDKAVLNLSSVTINSASAAGVSGVDVVAYLGDVLGTGVPNATDASLVDQVGSGSGTGFSAFKDLDPVIIGGPEGGSFVNANDASLINEAGSGQNVPQIPAVPTLPEGVTLTFGGPDPYLYLSAVQGSPGQTVTETLYLDVTDPNGIQLTALDEAIGFDASLLQISDVRSAADLAGLGSYDTASTVDNAAGVLLVGQAFMGSGLPPVVPYGTDVPVLQFNVTLNSDMAVGAVTDLTLLQNGSINGQVKYTAISDNEGALTWTPGMAPSNSGNAAVDGQVSVVAETPTPVTPSGAPATPRPVVLLPKVVEPVRRIFPTTSLSVGAASQTPATVGIAEPSVSLVVPMASETGMTAVDGTSAAPVSSQSPAGASVQPGTSGVSTLATVVPAEVVAATAVSSPARLVDSGVALSLVSAGVNKIGPTTSAVKASTSALDEVYRLLDSGTATISAGGWKAAVSSEGADADWFDSLYLDLVDEYY